MIDAEECLRKWSPLSDDDEEVKISLQRVEQCLSALMSAYSCTGACSRRVILVPGMMVVQQAEDVQFPVPVPTAVLLYL